jgi:hypothetical protein
MLAGMRLVRRLGLAIGAWFFVYYLAYFIGALLGVASAATNYAFLMAIGAAVLAFFLPGVEASSFTESDKESP